MNARERGIDQQTKLNVVQSEWLVDDERTFFVSGNESIQSSISLVIDCSLLSANSFNLFNLRGVVLILIYSLFILYPICFLDMLL
jgi:hypothetical protein